MTARVIAVVGASGVVGRALLEHLQASGETALGFSRRAPADLDTVTFCPLDLQDSKACSNAANGPLKNVTHLVYTALFEEPGLIAGWRHAAQMQTNLLMLQNLLAPLEQSSSLRHVTLLQGTKAYGVHVAPMKLPGLEREPRHDHENFYWLQQDYLTEVCRTNHWHYTIWRPQIIFGHALHAPMNLLAALGVYAALQQAQHLPFSYPGGPSAISEAVDARLLAKAITHSFDNDKFNNETFNITNGDVFRWQDLWPKLAAMFGMSAAEPAPLRLSETLYDREALWQTIVKRHNLQPHSLRDLVGDSFFYADAAFNASGQLAPPAAILSTIKLRQAGFHECIDTEQMFAEWLSELARLRIIPGSGGQL